MLLGSEIVYGGEGVEAGMIAYADKRMWKSCCAGKMLNGEILSAWLASVMWREGG